MKVFPAIDLLGGKAVRLLEGRRDAATALLMRELERSTSYKHWTILSRLWKEYSK